MNLSYYTHLGLNEPWAILSEYAQGFYPILSALSKGESLTSNHSNFSDQRQENRPYYILCESDEWDDDETNTEMTSAPAGSIAVLNLRGPVMKYSQWCGPVGTMDLAAELKRIDADSNFIGTIMKVESGGGQAFAIKVLTDQMDKRTKPIVILGGSVVASAAYAISVHGDEIIIDHPRAIIGSIGTMNFIQNAQPYFEKMGVEFHEIYATASKLKNNTYNQALMGNYGPIKKKSLDPLNEDFQQDVKAQRPGLSDKEEILQGETFMAVEALELGMIDHLGDMDLAISRVKALSKAKPKKSNNQNQSTNMSQFTNVVALAGIAAPTETQMNLANAELTLAGITHVTLVQESFITEAANVTIERDTLQGEKNTLTGELQTTKAALDTANSNLATANAKVTELQAQVDAFGANAGAVHQNKTGDDVQGDQNSNQETVISELPHNKAAAAALGM